MIFILLDFSLNQFKQTLKIILDAKGIKYDYFVFNYERLLDIFIYVPVDYFQQVRDIITTMSIKHKIIEKKININEFKFLKDVINSRENDDLLAENSVLDIVRIYRLAKEYKEKIGLGFANLKAVKQKIVEVKLKK